MLAEFNDLKFLIIRIYFYFLMHYVMIFEIAHKILINNKSAFSITRSSFLLTSGLVLEVFQNHHFG